MPLSVKISNCFNPFGTGQCLTTDLGFDRWDGSAEFQSLWNRAVSYDIYLTFKRNFKMEVSIPLEQGSVLRRGKDNGLCTTDAFQSLWNRAVSYDSDAIFHLSTFPFLLTRFNPFGTGQCLTTSIYFRHASYSFCFNPFGTGQCLTTLTVIATL